MYLCTKAFYFWRKNGGTQMRKESEEIKREKDKARNKSNGLTEIWRRAKRWFRWLNWARPTNCKLCREREGLFEVWAMGGYNLKWLNYVNYQNSKITILHSLSFFISLYLNFIFHNLFSMNQITMKLKFCFGVGFSNNIVFLFWKLIKG